MEYQRQLFIVSVQNETVKVTLNKMDSSEKAYKITDDILFQGKYLVFSTRLDLQSCTFKISNTDTFATQNTMTKYLLFLIN